MCCGSKRSAWRSALAPPQAAPAPLAPEPARPTPGEFGPSGPGVTLTKLRYWGSASIRLRGPITGRAYSFSGDEPVQEVDVRDAAILVRSTRFQLSTA
jgi:hypothetical protein